LKGAPTADVNEASFFVGLDNLTNNSTNRSRRRLTSRHRTSKASTSNPELSFPPARETSSFIPSTTPNVPSATSNVPNTTNSQSASSSSNEAAEHHKVGNLKGCNSIFKTMGNDAYSKNKWNEAIGHYTQAINLSPKPSAVYYGNRAAAYLMVQLLPEAINDCLRAIELDANFSKACIFCTYVNAY
jgi:tetratricopeptide (TPR) repeat protein